MDAAPSPWKAPSRGNRRARGRGIPAAGCGRSDFPRTWKTLAPLRGLLSDHTARRTRFPHFPPAHLGPRGIQTGWPWTTSASAPPPPRPNAPVRPRSARSYNAGKQNPHRFHRHRPTHGIPVSPPPAILLRQAWREGKRIRRRTIANLSKLPPALIDGIRSPTSPLSPSTKSPSPDLPTPSSPSSLDPPPYNSAPSNYWTSDQNTLLPVPWQVESRLSH